MYPNDPQPPSYQPPNQPPVDYLNQIAPQAPKKQRFSFGPKMLLILGGLLVLIMIIAVAVVNTVSSAQREPTERLVARFTATQAIADNAQRNIKSSQLRGLNSDLRIYFTNAARDIKTPMSNVGVNVAKLSSSATQKEAATAAAASERLEDARLNAVYDRTYAREMAYQLATLLALMQQVHKSTSSNSLKAFLQEAYTNLEPTQKALAAYNETTN